MSDRLDLDTEWMESAACNGVGTELFFDDNHRNFASARALCSACPVRSECLAAVLSVPGQQYGFQAGLTQDERRKMLNRAGWQQRTPAPINHGTPGGYRAHRRRGEEACRECLAANAEYQTQWKMERRDGVIARLVEQRAIREQQIARRLTRDELTLLVTQEDEAS